MTGKDNSMNIVLVGYRCSGKTSVGKLLAGKLDRDFLDTDMLMEERAGCSIETIVSRDGWDRFRDIERRLIKEVSEMADLVIATGGGVVMDEDNLRNLKRSGFVVWLKADAGILMERMGGDQRSGKVRPSLTGEDPIDEIERLLDIRNPFYERAGKFTIDSGLLPIQEVVDLIFKEYMKRA